MSQPPISGKSLQQSLDFLRSELLSLSPAGPNGFEGLVATALADLTGLTFRLAKSGSQFGRDASTPRAHFAIAMEAKRYQDSLRLEDVAGKIWIAAEELASNIDVWVLCATSEMGDGVLAKLEAMLEKRGISLLMLDWTMAQLSRLAVLLASARGKVRQWFEIHTAVGLASKIDAALADIEADHAFLSAHQKLKQEASAGYSGLGTLSETNRTWCSRVFSERLSSKQAFGQYLTVQDSAFPAIARPSIEAALNNAVFSPQPALGCIAILGPEGAGKSWLAAQLWVKAAPQPILIIGGTQVVDLIDPKDPLGTLARLISAQGEGDFDESAERWGRRLRRWRQRPAAQLNDPLRFLVVVDGLNERSGMPWADTIVRLVAEVEKLGGRLILTCRERFWDREIAPRLAGINIIPVRVGGYQTEELCELLLRRGIPAESIPSSVREFMRNPRICSVALDLLGRLSANADELTIERLLLEYWRRRLEERGDLTAHNIRDFEKLLRSHANALRKNRGVQFDRDDWLEHSGAAKRSDGRSVEHDLTDIEEGAFLKVVENEEGFYEFKSETVPFALGLMVARELQDEVRKSGRAPSEVIDSIVEEVQGFDLVGEALRSAAGIACFEESYPAHARAALISAWLELQNIPDSAYECLVAYTNANPEAVLDATETAYDEHTNARRRQWLLGALLSSIERPRVASAADLRIGKWLARWSRVPRQLGRLDDRETTRVKEQAERISERLSHLTQEEQRFFAKWCEDVGSPDSTQLDLPAAFLLAARPQAAYAESFLAWAFAWSVTGDYQRADVELAWVIRFNKIDFPEFERNLLAAVEALISSPHTEVTRKAAAIALRMLGTVQGSIEADRLNPRKPGERWRQVESLCATDPYDPVSEFPANLGNGIDCVNTLEPSSLWSQYVGDAGSNELESIIPALARFDIDSVMPLLRKVAREAQVRSYMPLRQLSWQLQWISPLFDRETLEAVHYGYNRLVQKSDLLVGSDTTHVPASVLLSLLPHFEANEQLQLYLKLPGSVEDWYAFREVFKALGATDFEFFLLETEQDLRLFRRVLFFASAHCVALTDNSRQVLARALKQKNQDVVTYASEVAYVARDAELDNVVITAAKQRIPESSLGDEAFWISRAVTAAVVSTGNVHESALITHGFLGFAAEQFAGLLDRQLISEVSLVINRLLLPITTAEPELGKLFLEGGRNGKEITRSVKDRAEERDEQDSDTLKALSKQMGALGVGVEEFLDRQEILGDESNAYLRDLTSEKAQALARVPDLVGLKRLVRVAPETVAIWVERILAETDKGRLSNIRNIALVLAEALAIGDPASAAALLSHVKRLRSPIELLVGHARVPQHIVSLFAGPAVEVLSDLRIRALDNAMTDADLETLVFVAESGGHSVWLRSWIQYEVESAIPGRIARALTVEGMRNDDEPSVLLSRSWGGGFLEHVAERARFAYKRNVWSRYWYVQAVSSSEPIEFWRFGVLLAGITDVRAFHWFDADLNTPVMQRFGSELFKRVRKAAEKRSKKRKDTLYGQTKPNKVLSQVLISQCV